MTKSNQKNHKIFALTIVMACLFFCSSVVEAQKNKNILTNADIVEMVKAGVPESTIVLAIQQSESNFDTSTKALIKLKNEGASAKILDSVLLAQTKPSNMPANADSSAMTEKSVKAKDEKPRRKLLAKEFTFELQFCKKSGQTIDCQLLVTNKSNVERTLWLFFRDTQIINQNGEVAKATKALLGDKNDDSYGARMVMISDIPVKSTITFSDLKFNVEKIKLLRISAATPDDPKNVFVSSKGFYFDFKDIDLLDLK